VHILVVDDEPHVTLVIEHAGQVWGADVHTAHTLEEARTVLSETPHIDVLLLDIRLPDGSGLEFLDELREQEPTKDMPVIILTGAGENQLMSGADRRGVRCVTKPFSPSKLGRMIAELIGSDPDDA